MLVSHDLGVVRYLCDDVVVLRDGLVVERGPTADVFANPTHPVHPGAARRRAAPARGRRPCPAESIRVFAARGEQCAQHERTSLTSTANTRTGSAASPGSPLSATRRRGCRACTSDSRRGACADAIAGTAAPQPPIDEADADTGGLRKPVVADGDHRGRMVLGEELEVVLGQVGQRHGIDPFDQRTGVGTSCRSQPLPSGSLNEAYEP